MNLIILYLYTFTIDRDKCSIEFHKILIFVYHNTDRKLSEKYENKIFLLFYDRF